MTRRLLLALVLIIIATSRSVQDGSSAAVSLVPALTGTPHVPTEPAYANRQSNGRVAPARDRMSESHASMDDGSNPSAGSNVPPTYAALGAMVEAEIGSVLLGGKASWYRTPGLTGAAGPVLRDVLGDWRGQRVTVCADRCVTVTLTDWCACGERGGEPTLIDLSDSAFRRLGPLSAGVLDVTIEIGGGPRPTLPPTDSLEARP